MQTPKDHRQVAWNSIVDGDIAVDRTVPEYNIVEAHCDVAVSILRRVVVVFPLRTPHIQAVRHW